MAGLTFGATNENAPCNVRADAQMLWAMNHKAAGAEGALHGRALRLCAWPPDLSVRPVSVRGRDRTGAVTGASELGPSVAVSSSPSPRNEMRDAKPEEGNNSMLKFMTAATALIALSVAPALAGGPGHMPSFNATAAAAVT
jgi:hypothetical protein